MKQSSIEWLEETLSEGLISPREAFKKAKQMHKQEIIESTKYGNSFEQGDLRFETYYKNTYEKEQN